MKKTILRFIFFLMLVLCVVFTLCRTTKTAVSTERAASSMLEATQNTNTSIPVETIPILACWGVQEQTVDRYRELKECGIDYNLPIRISDIGVLDQAMEAAKAVGVKIVIDCPSFAPEEIANRYKNHPALAGYHLWDEPHSRDFPRLGEYARKIQAIDNSHFCFVVLLGGCSTPENYGTATYREHIQLLVKEVPVQILTFDNYPIRINSSGIRNLATDCWYGNLEVFSDEARKAGMPFWAFALTTAHWDYPVPTLADLRLQVFSNLAYGAQGIQYFTYWTPPLDIANFHDAPIDIIGQKTPTWYIVQQMNKEIKALSNVFLNAQVIKVEHITINASGENGDVPIGTTRFEFANRPAEAQIITNFTPSNGTNVVVSFLKNGNRYYMVVINRNLEGEDNMSVTIEGDAGLQLIKKDGVVVPASSENSTQTVTPGDALIYGWDIK